MKAIFVILYLSLTLAYSEGNSQSFYGFEGGVSLTNLKLKSERITLSDEAYRPKISYSFLAFKEFPVNKVIDLKLGLRISNRGSRFIEEKINIHYLGLYSSIFSQLYKQFNLELGTELNYLLSSNSTEDRLKRLDFGLNSALNYQISKTFYCTLKYYIGLTNIIENQYNGINDNFNLKNRDILIGLGYYIK